VELTPTQALTKKASIALMLAFFSSCKTAQTANTFDPPRLLASSLECNRELDDWTARAFTDTWTDGGELVLATPNRIEIHPLDSVRAAPLGEGDELLVHLSISADPEQARSGSKTGFLCSEAQTEALSIRLSVFDFESEVESDCWRWGPDFDFGLWDYAPCGRVDVETTVSSEAN